MELFIVRMFTFLMSPQAYRLIELGNTFWLWGVLIVIYSVERIFGFRVYQKNIAPKNPRIMRAVFSFGFWRKLWVRLLLFSLGFRTFDFKRKGVISTKTPRIEFNLSNLHLRCAHELNIAFYCTCTFQNSRPGIFQLTKRRALLTMELIKSSTHRLCLFAFLLTRCETVKVFIWQTALKSQPLLCFGETFFGFYWLYFRS